MSNYSVENAKKIIQDVKKKVEQALSWIENRINKPYTVKAI